jgi:hypothetical protein
MDFPEQYDSLLRDLFPDDSNLQEVLKDFIRSFKGVDHFSRETNFVGEHKVGKDAFSSSPALLLLVAELRGIRQELTSIRKYFEDASKNVPRKKKVS